MLNLASPISLVAECSDMGMYKIQKTRKRASTKQVLD